MKRNFTNDNLEEFLRRSANGLRMRPSDKVWRGISNNLNRRKRRVGFALGALVLAIGTLGYFTFENNIHKPASGLNQPAVSLAPHQLIDQARSTSSGTQQTTPPVPSQQLAQNNLVTAGRNRTSFIHPVFSLKNETATVTKAPVSENPGLVLNNFTPTVVDSYVDNPAAGEQKSEQRSTGTDPSENLPLTIESVINSYKAKSARKRPSVQFYFTPTISYRRLGENKSFLNSQPTFSNPNYTPALIYDVNNVVTHKPNMGFELGMAVKYPVTQKMKVRGGLQFNVNRYDIKAYNAITSVTTIILNGRSSNRGADSLNALSRYSNANGYRSNWLENYYLQISAPVGVEFKLNNDSKFDFGVATTIQPTYVLGDRTYLISTNYKNYAEVPQLVRRWNVNTALETFVGYSTGKLSWQVGPQVRYQLLSSFINKYPVKENLFDFGLKIGVSVNPR